MLDWSEDAVRSGSSTFRMTQKMGGLRSRAVDLIPFSWPTRDSQRLMLMVWSSSSMATVKNNDGGTGDDDGFLLMRRRPPLSSESLALIPSSNSNIILTN